MIQKFGGVELIFTIQGIRDDVIITLQVNKEAS